MTEFIHCPECNSTKIVDVDTDENEHDEEATIECEDCGWEGRNEMLVSGENDDE